MARLTQKLLIEQIRTLKEIKPRQEWAVLLKSQILAPKQAEIDVPQRQAKSVGFMDTVYSTFFQKKLVYSFAAILLLIAGVFGFARYTMPGDLLFPAKKLAEQSQAALTGQNGFQDNVVALNNRVNDLAQVAKDGKKNNIPSAIDEIKINASALAKKLKETPAKDPATLKTIDNSLKTLADVPGTDLTTDTGVNSLYQERDQELIADLKTRTLTDDQNAKLAEVEDLYSQGKYSDAFGKIWDLSNNIK